MIKKSGKDVDVLDGMNLFTFELKGLLTTINDHLHYKDIH